MPNPQVLGFDEVFADPWRRGSVLGQRQWGARLDRSAHLLPFVYKLHRSLFLPDKWGVWLLGGVALIWLPAA